MISITDGLRCYYNSNMKEKTPLELERENRILQSNWNSLRELLENEKKAIEEDELFCYLSNKDYIEFILDKMNELEKSDNK